MAFKTILAVIGADDVNRDLEVAATLCEEVGAHLSVLVMALAAPPPIGEYAAMVSQAWLEERQVEQDRLAARAAAANAFVAARSLSAEVSSEYVDIASAADTVDRHARYADLTFAGPDLLSRGTLKDKAIEGALFSSGGPLMLSPAGAKATLKPKHVMIAWDSRHEAARAAREALPLIASAHEVRIVMVDPVADELNQGAEPGADAAAYLARHGARVVVDRLPSEGRLVADVLRRHAVDCAADLLVMGGYGHSRLRERIFGGVTHSMLENPPLPIMMAH